jgi:3-isopropylmalate/(R)-2-methylmalate dehydratase small subunit
MSIIKGKVWKYGDDVNTDVIFPGKYTYTVSDPKLMPKHALEDLDPGFASQVQPDDIIVAGKNWGCGSSREQAVVCLKESQLGAIVAKSFGRIYYRNCINNALPAITCTEAVDHIQQGEVIEIDLSKGELSCQAGVFKFPVLPDAVMEIFQSGGLIPYTKNILSEKQSKGA